MCSAENVPFEFYPLNSCPLKSYVWRHRCEDNPVGLYRWNCLRRCVVYFLQCNYSDRYLEMLFSRSHQSYTSAWWRHQMETFSALLALCAGNAPVSGEFPAQRPVTRSFDVFFDLRLNKQLSKRSWGWWFETLSRPLWRHCNESVHCCCVAMHARCGTAACS